MLLGEDANQDSSTHRARQACRALVQTWCVGQRSSSAAAFGEAASFSALAFDIGKNCGALFGFTFFVAADFVVWMKPASVVDVQSLNCHILNVVNDIWSCRWWRRR